VAEFKITPKLPSIFPYDESFKNNARSYEGAFFKKISYVITKGYIGLCGKGALQAKIKKSL